MNKGVLAMLALTVSFGVFISSNGKNKSTLTEMEVFDIKRSDNSFLNEDNKTKQTLTPFVSKTIAISKTKDTNKEEPLFNDVSEENSLYSSSVDIGFINYKILDHLKVTDRLGSHYSGINSALSLEEEFDLLKKEINPDSLFILLDFSVPNAYGNLISFSNCKAIYVDTFGSLFSYRKSMANIGYDVKTNSEKVLYEVFSIHCNDEDNNIRARIKIQKSIMTEKTNYKMVYSLVEEHTASKKSFHVGNIVNQDGGIVFLSKK